jgi:hypothetical protein
VFVAKLFVTPAHLSQCRKFVTKYAVMVGELRRIVTKCALIAAFHGAQVVAVRLKKKKITEKKYKCCLTVH